MLARTDLFGRIEWVPFQSLESLPPNVTRVDLEDAAYLATGSDNLYRGFDALRMLSLRVVLLTPLIPLMWFPGVRFFGNRIYQFVARNRYRISRCQTSICKSKGSRKP